MPFKRHELVTAVNFAQRHSPAFLKFSWFRGFDLGPIPGHQGNHLRLRAAFSADPETAKRQLAEARAQLAERAEEFDGCMREALAVSASKAHLPIPIVEVNDPVSVEPDPTELPPAVRPTPLQDLQSRLPKPDPDDDSVPASGVWPDDDDD